MAVAVQPFSENGVFISKTKISAGDKLTLSYKGLLAVSGAETVYAHIGYNGTWRIKASFK